MTLYDYWKTNTAGAFSDAVQLIALHCPRLVTPVALSRLLAAAARPGFVSEYDRGKVEQALRKAEAPAGDTHGYRTPAPKIVPVSVPADKPSVGTSAHARALHKLHSHHHALLVSAATDADRAEQAGKIMRDILPALDAEYDRLRAGGDPAAMPSADPEAPANSADTLRRLNTVRVRLSKLKHLVPAAPTLKRRQALENEQTEKEAERDRLELLLRT